EAISWMPEISRNSVVLPAPFLPTKVTISPAITLIDTPCSASIRSERLTSLSMLSTMRLRGAEIGGDHRLVGAHLGHLAFCERAALTQHVTQAGSLHQQHQVMLAKHDGDAGCRHRLNERV